MSPEKVDDAAPWSVVDAATHGSSTHPGSAQRALWPLEPLVPSRAVDASDRAEQDGTPRTGRGSRRD